MIIADTGFWIALANKRDAHHEKAKEALSAASEPLILTWPVMTEVCHLLLRRAGHDAQIAFLEGYRGGGFRVFALREEHADRICFLMQKYADLPMDLADASLLILAEALGHGRIFSTDRREFQTYRWKERHPFQNLLFE